MNSKLIIGVIRKVTHYKWTSLLQMSFSACADSPSTPISSTWNPQLHTKSQIHKLQNQVHTKLIQLFSCHYSLDNVLTIYIRSILY